MVLAYVNRLKAILECAIACDSTPAWRVFREVIPGLAANLLHDLSIAVPYRILL
jgi:hypothetical protein